MAETCLCGHDWYDHLYNRTNGDTTCTGDFEMCQCKAFEWIGEDDDDGDR